jgi:single-strand DNA-binding protein
MSVNKVILVGRLGQNPEIRYTPAGAAVVNLSIATDDVWVDKSGQKQEKTEWHRIVVWGKTAENCHKYLAKGRQIYVEGRLQTRQWQDKDGQTKYTTEVHAQMVQFLGSGSQQDRPNAGTREFGGGGDYPMPSGPSEGMSGGGPEYRPLSGGPASSPVSGVQNSQAGPLGGSPPMTSFTEDDMPF